MKIYPMFLVLGLTALASADILYLNDGSKLEGDVKRDGSDWIVTGQAGTMIRIKADNVKSIEITAAAAGADVALDRLASIQRSTVNITDIRQALDRYAQFIEQYQGTPAEKEARKQAAVWQDRLDRGMVKLGDQWLTPEQRAGIMEKSLLIADQARQLIKESRFKEAEPLLRQALAENPENVSAIYLRGLLLYQEEQFPAARKMFESINAIIADHAPTLNNLGVILWRQNQFGGALNYYDQAMSSAPSDQIILNNLAEAMHNLPENMRDSALTKRAAARFAEQDKQLQARLAPAGLFRWGATWVNKAELAELQAAEKRIKDKLNQMAADFDATQAQITRIEEEIDANERSMRRIESSRYTRDSRGNLVRVALPPVYYELQQDNARLQADRQALLGKLETLRQTAREVERQLPVPQYTGVHQVIGVEGTPLIPPPPVPATRNAE